MRTLPDVELFEIVLAEGASTEEVESEVEAVFTERVSARRLVA